MDAFDIEHFWYRSTIIETEEAQDEETGETVTSRVKVAFRQYLEDGSKIEEKTNRKYTGWDDRYDEWRPVESPFVQRYNSISRFY